MVELSELDTAILRELRERGVIRGYHAEADLAARPGSASADRHPHPSAVAREHRGVPRLAHELPETVGVFVVSGGDDVLLHVAVPNTDALYGFVIDRLTERPEVADVNTSVVYEHLRNFTIQPLGRTSGPTPRAAR